MMELYVTTQPTPATWLRKHPFNRLTNQLITSPFRKSKASIISNGEEFKESWNNELAVYDSKLYH